MIAENVKMNKGVGLKFEIFRWDLEYIYKMIREVDLNLRNPELNPYWHTGNWNDSAVGKICGGMYKLGMLNQSGTYNLPHIAITYHKKDRAPWIHNCDLDLHVAWWHGDNYMEDVHIHYPIARAVLEKHKEENGRNTIIITFYDKKGRVTLVANGSRGYEFRCKAGEYLLDSSLVSERKKKDVGGGCFYCNFAEYVKDNGIIYLQCNKYNGRVAEVEYDGEQYPEYCKRR